MTMEKRNIVSEPQTQEQELPNIKTSLMQTLSGIIDKKTAAWVWVAAIGSLGVANAWADAKDSIPVEWAERFVPEETYTEGQEGTSTERQEGTTAEETSETYNYFASREVTVSSAEDIVAQIKESSRSIDVEDLPDNSVVDLLMSLGFDNPTIWNRALLFEYFGLGKQEQFVWTAGQNLNLIQEVVDMLDMDAKVEKDPNDTGNDHHIKVAPR